MNYIIKLGQKRLFSDFQNLHEFEDQDLEVL